MPFSEGNSRSRSGRALKPSSRAQESALLDLSFGDDDDGSGSSAANGARHRKAALRARHTAQTGDSEMEEGQGPASELGRGRRLRLSKADAVDTAPLKAFLEGRAPNACLCLELSSKFSAPALKALARERYRALSESGRANMHLPTNLHRSLSFICEVHLLDEDGIKILFERAFNSCTAIGRYQMLVDEFLPLVPPAAAFAAVDLNAATQPAVPATEAVTQPREQVFLNVWNGPPWSVLQAYIFYIYRVLAGRLPNELQNQMSNLAPHLIRDAAVNHSWHIVQGKRRIGGMGTIRMENGLENMGNFASSCFILFIIMRATISIVGYHALCRRCVMEALFCLRMAFYQ